jgi:hypothetical protein
MALKSMTLKDCVLTVEFCNSIMLKVLIHAADYLDEFASRQLQTLAGYT